MRLLLLLLMICLSSCQILRPYESPGMVTSEEWKGPTSEGKGLDFVWWEIFEDEQLNQLIATAHENSPTLGSALERVSAARALVCRERSFFYPSVDFTPNYRIFSQSRQFANPVRDEVTFRANVVEYQAPFLVSYEFDLWQKFKNGVYSAVANAQAQEEAYCAALLTLEADIAEAYFIYRALRSEEEVLEDAIEIRETSVDILEARYNAGLSTYEDVSRAETELATVESQLQENRQRRAIVENQLAVLSGQLPSCFTLEPIAIVSPPPKVPALLPCQVMMRRPDVRELERTMASLYYQIGITYASFFPSLNIGSYLGVASPMFSDLFNWQSRLLDIVVDSVQNIFDGGYRCAELQVSKAQFWDAYYQYEEGVLNAFREVEDALITIERQKNQSRILREGVVAADTTFSLSTERYLQGLDNYLNVVDAQRTLLDTQREQVKVLGTRYTSTIQLIRALGGGWVSAADELEEAAEQGGEADSKQSWSKSEKVGVRVSEGFMEEDAEKPHCDECHSRTDRALPKSFRVDRVDSQKVVDVDSDSHSDYEKQTVDDRILCCEGK